MYSSAHALTLASLLAMTLVVGEAGCSAATGPLPPGDGAGPLSNGAPAPAPTTAPAPASPPTSPGPSSPPPSTPVVDAGAPGDAAGAGGWAGAEAGAFDAGRGGDAGTGATDGSDPSTLLSLCVGEINEVRNQNGAFPYAESTQLEAYAAQAATSDAMSGQSHGYFEQTNGGGVASTENEYDGAQIDPGGTAQQVLSQGLLDDEQQGGGGLGNLVTDQFSQVGCGFAQDGAGNWWVTIELQ